MSDFHRKQNLFLRIALGEAMHELGRAIEITRLQIANDGPPKPITVTESIVTGNTIIAPAAKEKK